MDAKKFTAEFNRLITLTYEDAKNLCRMKYRGSQTIYGVPFDDLFQRAIEHFWEYIVEVCESEEPHEVKPRLTESYVKNSLVQRFDREVGMARRLREPRIRPTNVNWIKDQYYADDVTEHSFQEVEIRELYNVLKGKTRAFVRMMERDGATVREVARKLGISTKQVAKARSNIQKLLKFHGYEKEECEAIANREGYRSYR